MRYYFFFCLQRCWQPMVVAAALPWYGVVVLPSSLQQHSVLVLVISYVEHIHRHFIPGNLY